MSVDATTQDAEPVPTQGDALIEVRDLVKEFPIKGSYLVRRQLGAVHAVDGVSFDVQPRRDVRDRGRERLRQVDHGAAAAAPARADVGLRALRRARDRRR